MNRRTKKKHKKIVEWKIITKKKITSLLFLEFKIKQQNFTYHFFFLFFLHFLFQQSLPIQHLQKIQSNQKIVMINNTQHIINNGQQVKYYK